MARASVQADSSAQSRALPDLIQSELSELCLGRTGRNLPALIRDTAEDARDRNVRYRGNPDRFPIADRICFRSSEPDCHQNRSGEKKRLAQTSARSGHCKDR